MEQSQQGYPMIAVEQLTKYYGSHLAVEDISFTIEPGHVYGFLGPNGAGKSTTMNIIAGCLSATGGRVLIDGHDIFEEPDKAKGCIGYLPEHPPLYLNESPRDYLRFVGQAKGLRGAALEEQIAAVAEKTGIAHILHRRIAQLSKGYRQRIGIAQALLGDPKVIILDEPTVGLDPIQIIEIRELITQLGKTHTVIFSSHILSEVQAICDRIVLIAGGRLVGLGTPEQLRQQLTAQGQILLVTDAPEEAIPQLLEGIEGITDTVIEKDTYTRLQVFTPGEDLEGLAFRLFRAFAGSGWAICEMTPRRSNLEDVFIGLTGAKEEEA